MKNSAYWKLRFEQLEATSNKAAIETFETVQAQYLAAEKALEQQISTWYQRFAKNNNISMAEARKLLTTKELAEFKWDVKEFIKYGEQNAIDSAWMTQLENASARFHVSRLEALRMETQQTVEKLFGGQTDEIDKLLKKNYLNSYYHSVYEIQKGFNIGWDIAAVDGRTLERLISKPWSTDGKNFSDRIWSNKSNLINEVQTQLTQTIMLGKSPDDAIKAIAKKMDTSKKQAGRLVMTESAYFSSQSQKDAFNELDVEQFEIVATLDSRTSEICQDLDGHVFDMKEFEPGVTAPPFHPWCRTTTVPYFDDNGGERAAKGADGKTYYVDGNMKYKDWKKTFTESGSKEGLKPVKVSEVMKGKSNEVKALKDEIMKKHDGILSAAQQTELDSILSVHDSDELNLYSKVADNVSSNEYHYTRKGAAYYPWDKKVKMNIDSNQFEKKIGSGKTGAWKTKFHEEFHQLDHMLAKTEFGRWETKYVDGTVGTGLSVKEFTSVNTKIGSKMISSIDDDVLAVMNQAIDWRNTQNAAVDTWTKLKPLKSLDRISSDAYQSAILYLKSTYGTEKAKAQIGMFTDAMGLTTKNRLNPHGNGFWGHDASYNKERGKSGATSETWATFGSLYYTGDAETVSLVKQLMPTTWETYSSVLKDVIEFALTNDIKY